MLRSELAQDTPRTFSEVILQKKHMSQNKNQKVFPRKNLGNLKNVRTFFEKHFLGFFLKNIFRKTFSGFFGKTFFEKDSLKSIVIGAPPLGTTLCNGTLCGGDRQKCVLNKIVV